MSAQGTLQHEAAPVGTIAPRALLLRAVGLLAAMLVAVALAQAMKPTRRMADHLPAIHLSAQVPEAFAGWRLDTGLAPVVPDPSLQARLNSVYDQTLARTYVNAQGERVMLTIAYGRDQRSEATAVHRPEFCYGAQGFQVAGAGVARVALASGEVTVQRLVAQLGPRVEPISYWVTLADEATLPGLGRKWAQVRLGLAGDMADGMLVRVSTIAKPGAAGRSLATRDAAANGAANWAANGATNGATNGAANDTAKHYAAQDRFLRDLADALPLALRSRYFGA